MPKKTKSGKHQLNLYDELKDILEEYSKELYEKKENALDVAADYLVDKLEQASPVDTGELRRGWLRTDKYKNVRYIGNSATTKRGKNKHIPLVNLVEFSENGKPFVRRTFEENKEQIIKIIKGELENGNTK